MKKRLKKRYAQENSYAIKKALEWIVHDINERKAEADEEENTDFNNGIKQAYFEVTDMIQSRLDILDVELDIDDDWSIV